MVAMPFRILASRNARASDLMSTMLVSSDHHLYLLEISRINADIDYPTYRDAIVLDLRTFVEPCHRPSKENVVTLCLLAKSARPSHNTATNARKITASTKAPTAT